jgi:hypothetical protein
MASAIVASAIKEADGKVYSLSAPARHHELIHHMVRDLGLPWPIRGEQGFVDEEGRFWDRFQAAKLVLANGQVEKLMCPGRLFSEDLW